LDGISRALLLLPYAALVLVAGCGGSGDDGVGANAANGAIALAWDANAQPELAGYKLYYGTEPNAYSVSVDVGMATASGGTVTFTLGGLTPGQTYYIAATAYDASQAETNYSDEVSVVAR
jgi:hypothetical protein